MVVIGVAVLIIMKRRSRTLEPLAASSMSSPRPAASRRNVEIDAGVVVARNDHVVINLDNAEEDDGEESD